MKNWICTEILKRETPQERAIMIEKFIQIGWVSYYYFDFLIFLEISRIK